MTWVGASLVSGLNTEIERFLCTEEEFIENGDKMPDRFGEAYLFARRDEPHFNPEFYNKNEFAK
jgi:hypothetical protein